MCMCMCMCPDELNKCVCGHACVHACMCACMHVCVCVCVCVCVQIHTIKGVYEGYEIFLHEVYY